MRRFGLVVRLRSMTPESIRMTRARLLAALLCLGPAAAVAQAPGGPPESRLLADLQRHVLAGDTVALARFWEAVASRTTPLVDSLPGDSNHVLATFVFQGTSDTRDVVLVAGPDGIAPFTDRRSYLRHLPGTDLWYVSHHLARDGEFFYQFSVNPPPVVGEPQPARLRQTLTADPLNPLQYPEPGDPMAASGHGSIARMPGVPPNPWLDRRDGVPEGVVQSDTIHSRILGGTRRVSIYATPGVPLRDANVAVFLDGGIYVNRIPTPAILDNLYAARKITPTVAVFVDNGGARSDDYYFSDAFDRFLADELLPWVERKYGVKPEPARTVVCGASLGGLASVYAALRRPDAFGKALSESGAFWVPGRGSEDQEPEWLARFIARAPRSNAFLYLTVGSNEFTVAGETTLLASNRHLRDILQLKGYAYRYVEVPGDHEPVNWRRVLPEGLMAVLGG